MRFKGLSIGLILIVLAATAGGGDGTGPDKTAESTQSGNGSDPSFQEILEFLGRWETEGGDWIDPTDTDWLRPSEQEPDDEASTTP